MKDVGYTKEGNRLVEMSEVEYAHFARLCMAVEGKEWPAFPNPRDYAFQTSFDFTKTFDVIRAFLETKFKANEFKNILADIWGQFENG